MGKAAYYLLTDSPPNYREFPLGERFESTPQGRRAGVIAREHTDLVHETEEGVIWNYPQVRRRIWELTYRCYTEAQLDFFETLHLNVDGNSDAFYFIPDVDESPLQEYLVRKEKDFIPPSIGMPTIDSLGRIVGVYDYVFRIKEESAAAVILA